MEGVWSVVVVFVVPAYHSKNLAVNNFNNY